MVERGREAGMLLLLVALLLAVLRAEGPLQGQIGLPGLADIQIELGASRDACQGKRLRKEIRQLSPKELEDFLGAVMAVKRSGVYDKFANLARENVRIVRGTPFFPWHREFIFQFERELREVNANVTLPYLEWSLDFKAPEQSLVFTDRYFGGQGTPCLTSGPFAGWLTPSQCLSRQFNNGDRIGTFFDRNRLDSIRDTSRSYTEYNNYMMGAPNVRVHASIGGDMGTAGAFADPLNYLHFGFMDKLWQLKSPRNLNDLGSADLRDAPLTPFSTRARDAMAIHQRYCYAYTP